MVRFARRKINIDILTARLCFPVRVDINMIIKKHADGKLTMEWRPLHAPEFIAVFVYDRFRKGGRQ